MESETFTRIFPKLAPKKLVARKLEMSFLEKLVTAREKAHGNAQLGNPREKESTRCLVPSKGPPLHVELQTGISLADFAKGRSQALEDGLQHQIQRPNKPTK